MNKLRIEGNLEVALESAAKSCRAAAITNETFARLAEERFTGRTERELAWWVERTMRDLGAEGVAFPPIVASGPNGALPHASPRDVAIEPGQTVVVDAAAKVDGYNSDCTRTFATGELPDELRSAYDTCRRAQQAALDQVKAGADTQALDTIARMEIEAAGHEALHGLGHGVGLEVHELPVLRQTAAGTLTAGNVVTIEPGVYLAGSGGVRIEDLVVVTEDGAEILSRYTKDLVTLN